ncbi:hybrid sensor histidine kinase/response regulator [Alkalimonas amylolytica]|uniref:Chemotaxis protein CheA n=1 Tax=Alkalimonas amylolytica TaxID=152573 RepID=A0A1H3ZHY4_ALKAM|nr:response regulator [Alkalimonas amylolytica]SEA23366.1 CheA signal transduction histidine kinase [Alkalimonas amylolytica]
MTTQQPQLQQRLLTAFRQEATERLGSLRDALASLEQADATPDVLETVYREVHSLKGAARAVNAQQFERLCQKLESLFSALKQHQRGPGQGQITLINQALQRLQRILNSTDEHTTKLVDADDDTLQALCTALEQSCTDPDIQVPVEQAAAPAEVAITAEPGKLRVSSQALDKLWFCAEDLLDTRLESAELASELKQAQADFTCWHRYRYELSAALRVLQPASGSPSDSAVPTFTTTISAAKTNTTITAHASNTEPNSVTAQAQHSLIVFAQWATEFLQQWDYRISQLARMAAQLAMRSTSLETAFRQELQQVLLMPCASLTEGMPAMVQELAEAASKSATLTISGAEYQVDKRILEELRSPLQHLLRNAVDHGIETVQQRKSAGKAGSARLSIDFIQLSSNRFGLRFSDDGRGIDTEAVTAKAIQQGVLTRQQASALSDAERCRLIFRSGLSTSPMLTELSGRGLGLAIVEEKVLRLNGDIEICNQPGQGCSFMLALPVSLSTYRILLVRVAGQLFAIPCQSINRVLRMPATALRSVENRAVLPIAEQSLPLWSLADLLQLTPQHNQKMLQLILVETTECQYLLQVDEILTDQDITLKSLGPQLKRVTCITGVARLGNGQLVPVLNMQDLYKRACRTERPMPVQQSATSAERQKLLVAEDSITSRSLMKSILETAGFQVVTAVDGVDAWQALQQSDFAALISDIEMPGLDGFSLTAKVRSDSRLANLPVVLVTALQSKEDRVRGLEAGANAYILKSSFEQDHLLDILQQLLSQEQEP